MRICFDMDGTIADLYSVENWLPMLRAADPTPYEKAAVMCNMARLARILNRLQKCGYEIGVVSWLAKNSSPEYNAAVTAAKKRWLAKHLASVKFDFVEIVAYGTPKGNFSTSCFDVLFDDEKKNREMWPGTAVDGVNFELLKDFIKNPIMEG